MLWQWQDHWGRGLYRQSHEKLIQAVLFVTMSVEMSVSIVHTVFETAFLTLFEYIGMPLSAAVIGKASTMQARISRITITFKYLCQKIQ